MSKNLSPTVLRNSEEEYICISSPGIHTINAGKRIAQSHAEDWDRVVREKPVNYGVRAERWHFSRSQSAYCWLGCLQGNILKKKKTRQFNSNRNLRVTTGFTRQQPASATPRKNTFAFHRQRSTQLTLENVSLKVMRKTGTVWCEKSRLIRASEQKGGTFLSVTVSLLLAWLPPGKYSEKEEDEAI
ncbi:hypothetical protein CDAR_55831 [Caerostris darwini]|uniref:Uncharacterized protein n=1 Tax=Caerostris darwini TaxID=1538125 RepID=A0AAV4VAE2_9ARAC|nr:hypothetical protein CDAR_55831 [Caerostris darwini]